MRLENVGNLGDRLGSLVSADPRGFRDADF